MEFHLEPDRAACFPLLRPEDYTVTAESSFDYNCVAHAAGVCDIKWWPMTPDAGEVNVYWPVPMPTGTRKPPSVIAEAFVHIGYSECGTDESLELGYEKVAIYADRGEATHAARQLPSGRWTSKLGDWQVIEHASLRSLESPPSGRPRGYGRVALVLPRPRQE